MFATYSFINRSRPRFETMAFEVAPTTNLERLGRFFILGLVAAFLAAAGLFYAAAAHAATSQLYNGLVGTVSNPATITLSSSNPSAAQTLVGTRFDLDVGTLPSGSSWSGATVTLYVNAGSYATSVPTLSITDSSGSALTVTASATVVGTSTNGAVNYVLSGDLPANAVMHFSGFVLSNLADKPSGTQVQIIAMARASDESWRGYSTFQTLATIASNTASTVTPQSGWWWSSAEPGRGYAIEAEAGHLMFAAYMYRSDGTSVWYVASGALSGSTFTASLHEFSGGGTLGGSPHAATDLGSVATITVAFSSSTQATITWGGSVFGSSAPTSSITRFSFTGSGGSVTAPASSAAPVTGWYWNSEESGTGWFIEMQGSQIFLATYMYGSDGTARWYAAQGTPSTSSGVFGSTSGLSFTATLYEYGGGQTLTSGHKSILSQVSDGSLTLVFSSTATATVTLPSGRQLQLTRFTQF